MTNDWKFKFNALLTGLQPMDRSSRKTLTSSNLPYQNWLKIFNKELHIFDNRLSHNQAEGIQDHTE